MSETSGISIALFERAQDAQIATILATEQRFRVVALSSRPEDMRQKLRALKPQLAVLDASVTTPEELVAVVEECGRSGVTAVAVGDVHQASVLSRAVLAGARCFLTRPLVPDDVVAALYEVAARARGTSSATRQPRGQGALVAVYGPKGGVGVTTIATNVACALAAGGTSTAIVDLDLQFGDVGIALDLKGVNSVADLVAHQHAVDRSLVDELFVQHRSGLRALLAPESTSAAESLGPRDLMTALDRLRPFYDRIVCDLPSHLGEVTRATLAEADLVVLVATPELAALKDLQRAIISVPSLGRSDGRVVLVLNRHPSRGGLERGDVEGALGRKVTVAIPSDGAVITSALNAGMTMILAAPRAKASRAILELAEVVRAARPAPGQIDVDMADASATKVAS